jgi:thiamine kinase-like enzyme
LLKYKNLVLKYKNLKKIISHNDLSSENLLWNQKEHSVYFIDYEWGRMNNIYWDFANFIRETNLKKQSIDYLCKNNKLKRDVLMDFVYICINYAYQWTFAMPQTKKILTYRKKILAKLQKYN